MPAKIRKLPDEHSIERVKKVPMDAPLLLTTLLLIAVGLIALFTASYPTAFYNPKISSPIYFVVRQGGFALAGLICMVIISKFDYHKYHLFAIPLYIVSIILLTLVLVPGLGKTINNATRWLKIGLFFGPEYQPSEIAKMAIIFLFSSFASIYNTRIKTFVGLLPYGVALLPIIALLFLEPHLSATIIIVLSGVTILFVAGMRLWYFVPAGIAGAGVVALAYRFMNHVQTRIAIWLDPFSDFRGDGWQGANSFIAIGSGGLWGLGLGRSRQKYLYLPEPQNDFIFSVICEELGFIGALLVMFIFAYFIYRGFHIAMNARDRFGCFIATGITAQFAIQTLVNLCVVSGLMPVTGASLPFFSYGGTALMMQLFEVGILLNVSRQIPPDRVD